MNKNFQSHYIPYLQTGKFSKIVLDYIGQATELNNFYEHRVNIDGIKNAIAQRKSFGTNRHLLVKQLQIQYQHIEGSDKVKANIQGLLHENTFTVCTAHQPNIFTGHLYFIYKILHVIKLANRLKKDLPEYNFVPVFFVGSEDADLEELNHIVIDGEKYEWETHQTGAVGRMKIDDSLVNLIDRIAGRLGVEEYGNEITGLLKSCYKKNTTIEQATFLFVHELFKNHGLVVLLPDDGAFKNEMLSIFKDDIFNHSASEIVTRTSEGLPKQYKAQAYPREINLFYLKDNIRNRIVAIEGHYEVAGTGISFTKEEIENELVKYPERFSPNVILRGLFQEIILPGICFVGGGGELAYWLQLKELFEKYKTPFPVLVVRNSFLIIEKKYGALLKKLHITSVELFKTAPVLFDELVKKESKSDWSLKNEKSTIGQVYKQIKQQAEAIDSTLGQHVAALETREMKALDTLEKKMLRAEKKKFESQKNQLTKIYSSLFPDNGLQERTENFMYFYAKWGEGFMKMLYDNSLTTEQEFCIIEQEV